MSVGVHFQRVCQVAPWPWWEGATKGDGVKPVTRKLRYDGSGGAEKTPRKKNQNRKEKPHGGREACRSPGRFKEAGRFGRALHNVGKLCYMTQFPKLLLRVTGDKQDNPWETIPHARKPLGDAGHASGGMSPGLGVRAESSSEVWDGRTHGSFHCVLQSRPGRRIKDMEEWLSGGFF